MGKNDDKLKELLEKAEQGTREVFESDKYKNYLSTMAKFHNYSYRNSLLILMQKPEASYVAGYAAWQKKFNRQVQRGEKGIQIVGYTPRKVNVEQKKMDSSGRPIIGADGQPVKETVTRQIPSFTPVYVYDISQTDGEPLPQLINELDGSVEAYKDLMQAIHEVSPFPIFFEEIKGGAKGYCDPMAAKIVIQQGMSEVQSVKTAIHEVTHADLHAPEVNLSLNDRTDRRTREVEAESTAFVVCSHYGIDTSDYTFPYLASWSSSKELTELQGSLITIQSQAGDLIDKIDTRLAELKKNREISPELAAGVEFPKELQPDQDAGYKIFYGGLGGQDQAAHDFQKETGWNMAWGSDSNGLNGDTWIVYRSIDELPKPLQGIVPTLEHKVAGSAETLDSIKFDGDIDLDRGKNRDQLGFRDSEKQTKAPPAKMSMAERMAAAKSEADRRNSSHTADQQHGHDKERGGL